MNETNNVTNTFEDKDLWAFYFSKSVDIAFKGLADLAEGRNELPDSVVHAIKAWGHIIRGVLELTHIENIDGVKFGTPLSDKCLSVFERAVDIVADGDITLIRDLVLENDEAFNELLEHEEDPDSIFYIIRNAEDSVN
jgi:hypothetical protein